MNTQINPALLRLLNSEIKKHSLPSNFIDSIKQWLIPIAQSINTYRQTQKSPIIISFNGAQGSGKSTLTHFIALLLTHHFKQQSINVSLDDFYLSKQQRIDLALKVHPLFKTRGVPGTHDLNLAISTLTNLTKCTEQSPCFIPQFDKANDDQATKEHWIKMTQPMDIILFEGWCNHAPIQSTADLIKPINTLEENEDANGLWRTHVNEQLKIYHRDLFSLCDLLYFIKIPSFKKVYEWRGLQENKLEQKSKELGTMNNQELIRFIQHFERLTQQCLKSLTENANTVIELNDQHEIKQVSNI